MAIPGYKILNKINEGGMATVYLAVQLSVGREVALKIMSPELSADTKYSNRFYKEANIVGTLSHPNIVSIYDVGKHDGYNYIAMDYLPGASFKERIHNGLSISEVLRLIKEIASALDHMHDRGYVHLDLKPDNILFRKDGSAVLLDFGIAMTIAAAQKANNSGSVAGTPQYMSPEQAQGKPLDGRSDLYSLGILFYEMLTGEPPYRSGDAVQIAVKHMTAALPSLPAQYKMFQPLLNRMLAKKAEARFSRGSEIIQAINALEGGIGHGQNLLLEPTQPTALQAFSLVKALTAALGALLSLMLKGFFARFAFLARLRFSPRLGLVLRQATPDPLEQSPAQRQAGTDTHTADFGDSLEEALKHRRARRLAPPLAVYAALALSGIAIGFGLYRLSQTEPAVSAAAAVKKPMPADRRTSPQTATPTAMSPATPPVQATAAAPVPARLHLTLNPTDAQARILELDAPYQAGMPLSKGHYTLAVSHPDYWPQQQALAVETQDIRLEIRLKARTRSHAVGEYFQDELPGEAQGPVMAVLPAGDFLMGDPTGKITHAKPAVRVRMANPFAIGRYEVTWGEYRHYLRMEKLDVPSGVGGRSDLHPVTGVNWDDAKAYVSWLAKVTGKPYRLPSEAEWEYAARAGTDTPYWWGGSDIKDMANCRRGCTTTWSNSTLFEAMKVGSFRANRFGLFDTAGNAAEWVEDCHVDSYQGLPEDGSARADSGQCYHRVVRGGSFNDPDSKLLSRAREKGFAQIRKPENGFRVALSL